MRGKIRVLILPNIIDRDEKDIPEIKSADLNMVKQFVTYEDTHITIHPTIQTPLGTYRILFILTDNNNISERTSREVLKIKIVRNPLLEDSI